MIVSNIVASFSLGNNAQIIARVPEDRGMDIPSELLIDMPKSSRHLGIKRQLFP